MVYLPDAWDRHVQGRDEGGTLSLHEDGAQRPRRGWPRRHRPRRPVPRRRRGGRRGEPPAALRRAHPRAVPVVTWWAPTRNTPASALQRFLYRCRAWAACPRPPTPSPATPSAAASGSAPGSPRAAARGGAAGGARGRLADERPARHGGARLRPSAGPALATHLLLRAHGGGARRRPRVPAVGQRGRSRRTRTTRPPAGRGDTTRRPSPGSRPTHRSGPAEPSPDGGPAQRRRLRHRGAQRASSRSTRGPTTWPRSCAGRGPPRSAAPAARR